MLYEAPVPDYPRVEITINFCSDNSCTAPTADFLSMVRLLAHLVAFTASILSAEGSTVTGRVVKVYDGDSITELDGNYTQHKIRLDGVDAHP